MSENLSTPPDAQPPRYSPALIVMAIIPILGLAAALGLLLAEASTPKGNSTQPYARVGSLDQPMPEFTLTSLDGRPVDLTQYRGRPIFVNFWGTWCPPCVDELPELQAFAAAQGETGAVVVASNNSESTETIEQYFEDNGLTLPDILFVLDPDHVMYRWFGVYNMPTTYLVDADGVVRSIKMGPFDAAEMQTYLDEIAVPEGGG